MKRISNKIVIAVALLAIAVVIYYYQNIKVHETSIQESSVIVANEDIPVNTLITEDMIILDQRYTPDLVKKSEHITGDETKIVGKRTKAPIYKGEEISTMRLVENKEYMEEDDSQKRTMFTISVSGLDKALNISKGSYIDIWFEPNQTSVVEAAEFGMEEPTPVLLFEKYRIYDMKTETYLPADNSSEETIMGFLTLYLTDDEITTYLSQKEWNYNKRITLHGENLEYIIINEDLEKEVQEEENTEVDTEAGTETNSDGMDELDSIVNP